VPFDSSSQEKIILRHLHFCFLFWVARGKIESIQPIVNRPTTLDPRGPKVARPAVSNRTESPDSTSAVRNTCIVHGACADHLVASGGGGLLNPKHLINSPGHADFCCSSSPPRSPPQRGAPLRFGPSSSPTPVTVSYKRIDQSDATSCGERVGEKKRLTRNVDLTNTTQLSCKHRLLRFSDSNHSGGCPPRSIIANDQEAKILTNKKIIAKCSYSNIGENIVKLI
jgi:hypothetical protein